MREALTWPFFDDAHRRLALELEDWLRANLAAFAPDDVDAACRALVAALGRGGWLRYCVPAEDGGALAALDSRALCLIRETLGYHEPLADFAFAMQGLGSGPITLAGTPEQRRRFLPPIIEGRAIAAFALSERTAGSDAAAIATRARHDGDDWILSGEKTWISNAGIADLYVVFARTSGEAGSRGIGAFVVDAAAPGLFANERIETLGAHPLGTVRFQDCRVPAASLLGDPGEGFRLAMRTLDIFRASVAAAALGFARRAFDAAADHVVERSMFGRHLADFQLTQAAIADMATALDASALLTYRAAWARDVGGLPATREAAMAKYAATENAQKTIDRAVQLFGALGVARGNVAERLYREIRALRIYEGASEVQQMVIARATMASRAGGAERGG
jgi:acyl-CoA dehydrogenase